MGSRKDRRKPRRCTLQHATAADAKAIAPKPGLHQFRSLLRGDLLKHSLEVDLTHLLRVLKLRLRVRRRLTTKFGDLLLLRGRYLAVLGERIGQVLDGLRDCVSLPQGFVAGSVSLAQGIPRCLGADSTPRTEKLREPVSSITKKITINLTSPAQPASQPSQPASGCE